MPTNTPQDLPPRSPRDPLISATDPLRPTYDPAPPLRDPDSPRGGTGLIVAGVAVVAVIAGLVMFTGGRSDPPSTAEQPRTEQPRPEQPRMETPAPAVPTTPPAPTPAPTPPPTPEGTK